MPLNSVFRFVEGGGGAGELSETGWLGDRWAIILGPMAVMRVLRVS